MKAAAVELSLSALLAFAVIFGFWALGVSAHRQHAEVAVRQERRMLVAAGAVPGASVAPGSAEHHTMGYADRGKTCAAESSLLLRTTLPAGVVLRTMGAYGLPRLSAELAEPNTLRIVSMQTFGLNPFDWSCWQ